MKLDLHIHSTASDGTLDYDKIIDQAKEKDLVLFSITDHDNINIQKKASEYAKSKNINFVTGVEISTDYVNMLDILGYGIDLENKILNNTLSEIQDYRIKRNYLMIDKLNSLGINIGIEDVKKVAGSEILGRPHIARVMMNKGYVNTIEEAFNIYLGNNKKAFIPKIKLLPEKAIEIITNAGGKAVLAHPKYISNSKEKLENLIRKFKENGLWGIEAYYSKHTKSDIDKFINIANKFDLNVTAGSDFHGDNKPEIKIGMEIESDLLNKSINNLINN